MAISFAPLKDLIPLSRLKHQKVIGGATYDVIRASIDAPVEEGVSISAIDAICKYLGCQPGDIMRYVEK